MPIEIIRYPLGILLVLLLALPTKAETSFVIESAWYVGNNEILVNNFTGNANLKFPEEIPANAAWAGATVTDGNIIGTIIALAKPKEDVLSGFNASMFRLKLRLNSVIATAFPNGFQILHRNSDLYLVSPELSEADLDVLKVDARWGDLRAKSHFGFIQYYPERTLLPTLPPEQEDESEFVKKVRTRSADCYKDGQYTRKLDSWFMGLRRMEQQGEFEVVYEWQNVEGSPPSDMAGSQPFNFGGFIKADAPFNTAFRVPGGIHALIEAAFFYVQAGVSVTPLEKRKRDGHRYEFYASATINSKLEEKDGYHMINDGNLFLFYPKQLEDRPEEDGVLRNEELDKINEELVRSFSPFFNNVRESLLSLDWSQPIDLAVSYENSIAYLACAYPPAETYIDWNLAVQLAQDTLDRMYQIKPFDLPPDLPSLLSLVKIQETSETIAGLPSYRMNVFHEGQGVRAVYVSEPGIFYAAVHYLEDHSDEVTEEQYKTMQRRLEEKIEASRQSVAEKMPPPLTVLHSNKDGTKLRINYEAIERGHRVTAYIAQESFGNVLALAGTFGLNPIQMLPFWQTQ